MSITFDYGKHISFPGILFYLLLFFSLVHTTQSSESVDENEPSMELNEKSEIDLKAIPYKIIYETYRETDGKDNWELFLINADGSNASNLTQTPDLDEMYPHASPDGTKICFVTDEKKGKNKVRNVYYMNVDGTGRVKVADNATYPCWSQDSKIIAYTMGEFDRYTTRDYATKGLFLYNIETGEHRVHPNKTLSHLFNICWPPEGKWFIATIHGGMGYDHTNLAIDVTGTKVFDLGLKGCRPDVTRDGKKIVWSPDDEVLWVADVDLSLSLPRIVNKHLVFAQSGPGIYQQHADWAPHGQFIAFSRGPRAGGEGHYPVEPGKLAKGWNICIGDLSGKWVQITTDGKHNKEPDWVPISK